MEVVLDPQPGEQQTTVRRRPSASRLDAYVAGVSTLGVIALAAILALTDWSGLLHDIPLWPTLILAAAAIFGELRPIVLPRAGGATRSLSTSAPFVLALVGVAGLTVAVLVQVAASLTDDLLQRRALKKSLFNTAQYTLSVASAGLVYALLTNSAPLSAPMAVEPRDIGALMVGGLVMFGVNWVLVAGIVSRLTEQRLFTVLRSDSRDFFVTNLVLLSIGGIAALIAAEGAWALILLAAPAIAAHLFTQSAARHAYDATHDQLTGLGNRSQLHYEIVRGLANAQRTKSDGPGLVLLDLDHFKDINDTLGHPFGDLILRKVAEELTAAAPDNATVHRLGGDEFAVVVMGDMLDSATAARNLLGALETPVHIEGLELLVRASAGVAVAPHHGTDSDTLMKNVDIALYHAKLERDRISMYSSEFDINTLERLQLLADLRTAIHSNELHVVYQPQLDLSDGSLVGVEALVRWSHPRRGEVTAEDFIALAESSGLVVQLTAYVMNQALAQLADWRAQGYELRMAVNLSARLLSDLALPEQVRHALLRHEVPASSLVLEVTETGILADAVRADTVVHALRALGVAIAIDDYGTGNASLNYLKRLEIDELKIDRSFVSNIGTESHDLIIVRSTISLARALGLRVVAEGIEDEATAASLRALGCPIGQGFHLGIPVPAAEITELLAGARRAGAQPS
ncbi:putative bifunctional diguanylate cyclase/phosphodiesterase [Demequina sp.]|uniref:putative bifunctional diguanylate cyclase/phosphodiesterase n=1 Tax=Demequina sp. TaxID=2050685 RepID=UPI003D0E922E